MDEFKIDITEIRKKKCKSSIVQLIKESGFAFKIVENYWSTPNKPGLVPCDRALVFGDLHALENRIMNFERDFWRFKVSKERSYFVSLIRNKKDENAADMIDDLMRITNNRLTVIRARSDLENSRESREFLTEMNRILARHFNPDALRKVSYNKLRNEFYIEFNDGVFGEIKPKELELEQMEQELILESPAISEYGDALELYTLDGESFDIDALLLKSMLDSEARDKLVTETKLTAGTVGEIIRSARKEKNLTQMDLANKTNIDQAIISKIETGKHLPRFDTIQRLANGFGINVGEMLRVH